MLAPCSTTVHCLRPLPTSGMRRDVLRADYWCTSGWMEGNLKIRSERRGLYGIVRVTSKWPTLFVFYVVQHPSETVVSSGDVGLCN